MINFISAENGAILLLDENGEDMYIATSPALVADAIKDLGLAEKVMHSSTMDFASEEGFTSDGDAWKMFKQGQKLAQNNNVVTL
jgi:hypothetical protein